MSIGNSVEIMEDIEPREVESGVPEWAWNPAIQIVIIWWWRIVGHDRRTFGIVVIIDHRWFSVLRSRRIWTFSIPIWYFSNDR
jgi:hypothetical protein